MPILEKLITNAECLAMNDFVRIAQAGPSSGAQDDPVASGAPGTLTVERPTAQQSIVMLRTSGQLVDFRQVLNENISFIRIDGDLQMVFPDGGMVIIQDFFAGDFGTDALIIGEGEFLSIDGFVSIANLESADEIQTAAGQTSNLAAALGSPEGSGQTFEPTTIGDLGDGLGFASLLQGEDPLPREFVADDFLDEEVQSSPSIGTPVDSTFGEENLPEGTDPANPVSATASLDVSFGENPGNNPRLEFDGLPSGLTSDGVPLVSVVSSNSNGGETLTVRKDGSGEIVFTVSLEVVGSGSTANGQYTVVIFGNLDHVAPGQDGSIPLVFGFSAFDSDGDSVSASFTVNVIDDTPVAGESETQEVREDNLANGTDPDAARLVAGGDLNIEWGADNADLAADGAFQDTPGGVGNRSVVFAAVVDQPAETQAAKSDGVELEFELSENDTVLTAFKGAGRLDADKVFVVSLSDDGTGRFEFELLGNIDHGGQASEIDDVFNLDFAFQANDSDGDAVDGSFGVTIADDEAVAGTVEDRSVDESNLDIGTDPNTPAATTGNLNIAWGADDEDAATDAGTQDTPGGAGNRSVVFAAIEDQPTQTTTSGGAALQYVLSEGNTVLTALDGAGGEVFKVVLSDDGSGSYTFTLLGSIDHDAPGTGDGSQSWDLDFKFFAVDGDQDATPGVFRVTVQDDKPISGVADQTTLQENTLANGTAPDPEALAKTGSLNIAWGADDDDVDDTGGVQDALTPGNRSVVFAAVDAQPTQETTSDGVALEYVLSADNTVLTAYKGAGRTEADKVFIVSLADDGTGSYTFELLGNVDHNPPGSGGQTDAWNLDFAFVASDSDGDTDIGSFRVTIVDDEPAVGTPERGVVEEENLPGGLDDPYPFFLDGAANVEGTPLTERFTGSLNIVWGADDNDLPDVTGGELPIQDAVGSAGQRSVVFSDAADGLVADPGAILSVKDETGADIDLSGLTSRTDTLSYVLSENGTHLTAYANYGEAEERSVFRVALSDDASGSYTLVIDDVLDHPIVDSTPFDEDYLSLNFGFVARDAEGDRAAGSFEVLVLDDGPLFRTDDVFKIEGLEPTIFTETADLRIPEEGSSGTIFSVIEVPDAGTIQDVNVSIEMQHGFIGDLDVFLISPDGTQIQLMQRATDREGSVDGTVSFDDDASTSIDDAGSNIVGTWRPADDDFNMDFLEGRDQAGLWILEISDRLDGDVGRLISWTLEIQSGVSAVVDEDDLSLAQGDNVDSNDDQATGDDDVITNASLDDDTDPTTVFGNLGVLWGADNENEIENGGTSAGIGDRAVTFVDGVDGTIDGLLDQGLTSNGEALSYALNASGDVLTASAGNRTIFTVELSDLDTGSFKFNLQDALDHAPAEDENDIILNFLFVATDSDGDTGVSTFSVAVDDDIPAIGDAAEDLTVSESAASPVSGNLGISWGADTADAAADGAIQDTPGGSGNRSVVFAPLADQPTQATTSDGVALEYVLSADDTVLAAYKGAGRLESDKVFEVSLSDDAAGSYTFELQGPIDHVNGQTETWDLDFAYVASDSDGDTLEGAFLVTVRDDAPLAGTAEEVAVSEENLADGTNPDAVSLTKTGELDITWGADDTDAAADGAIQDTPGGSSNRSVVFAPLADQPTQATTSDGVALEYVLSAGDTVLTAYKGAGRLEGDKVFEVSLSDDAAGSYTFELLGVIDHVNGQTEIWDLDFAYVASDSDGDTVEGAFLVTVRDDAPLAGAAEEVAVSEENLADGTNPDAVSLTKTGELDITWGADDTDAAADGAIQDTPGGSSNRSVVFAPLADQPTQATTSDGVALEYVLSADDTVLTAYKGAGRLESDKVFEVSLSDDAAGSYTFELLGVIDHVNGQTEIWDLDFAYVASDSDGDTAEGAFLVTVRDDAPLAGAAEEVAVSEENLADGTNPDAVSLTKTGELDITWGADDTDAAADGAVQDTPGGFGNRSVVFAPLADQPTQATTSDGVALEYVLSAGDTVLTAYKGAGRLESDKVFEVSLSDDGTGAYTFELLGAIDHVNGQTEIWDLDFAYVASDSDGDTVEGAFLVTVGDDAPDAEIRTEGTVRVDETYGLHSDNVFDPFTGIFDPSVVALFNGVTSPGTDPELPGPVYASDSVVGFDVTERADGLSQTDLTLRIDDPASGLMTTEGKAITLSLENGLVVGRIDGNGDAAFAIDLDDQGNVSIVQYLSLRHPDTTTSDEHITLDGKLSAVLSVTDGDGDIVTKDVAIGNDVTFDDDGPSAFRRGSGIVGNESAFVAGPVAGQLQFDGGADGATVTGISFVSNGSYIRTTDPDASGAARRGDLSAEGVPLTWSTSTNGNGVITVVAVLEGTTTKAFEIVVNPDGSYTYEQFVGFDHPDSDQINAADQLIFRMRFTVTDGDGDTDTAIAAIRVRDDGPPEIGEPTDGFVAEDGLTILSDVDLAIDWGVDDADGSSGGANERSVGFSDPDAASNVSISDASGSVSEIYSNGELVKYAFVNDVLVGYTGTSVPGTTADSTVVFVVVLSNEGSGSYDFVLLQPLDHTEAVGSDQFFDLSFSFSAKDSDFDSSTEASFTIRIDAAGSAGPVDYSNLTSDVFVNLSDEEQSFGGQTVSAETATDRAGVAPKVVGNDNVEGNDTAEGGAGNDVLVGNANNNTLTGNGGDDTFIGNGGINLFNGGEGSDTAVYSDESEGVFVRFDFGWSVSVSAFNQGFSSVFAGIANNTIDHDDLVSIENVVGTDFVDFIYADGENNTIIAGGGNDIVSGFGGDDVLIGGAGNDRLVGGSGNNKLIGGTGQDTLLGGTGIDEFVFAAGEGSNTPAGADQIRFFQGGIDKIVISGGLTFSDLAIGDDGFGNATIYDNVNNQYVAVVNGVSASALDPADFIFGSDPIVLDLDGDGVELTSNETGVAFDHNADGEPETAGWAGADDGLLVMDIDGSGRIENGSEVFSEVFNGGSYANSLEALASLDENGDGVIDANDSAFGDISVWQDAKSDGVTQDGELKSLADLGIEAIGLQADSVYKDVAGNSVYAEGEFRKADGSVGSYAGVSFTLLAGENQSEADETTRQSTAIAAGVGLVVYAASAQEVAAGLSDVRITTEPQSGEITVTQDFTVSVAPASGFEGTDTVEFELLFSDGSVVTREVTFEAQAETVAASDTQDPNGDSVETTAAADDRTDATSVDANTDLSELAALVTGSVIRGDDGDNVLVGTAGDDILIGGLGADTLTGGDGADTFVLSSLAEADIITDYEFGQGDTIDLGNLLDGAFGPGSNAEEYVRAQKHADGDVTLAVDLDGQGTGHDWQDAATLQGHATMGESIRVVLDTEGTETQIPVNVA